LCIGFVSNYIKYTSIKTMEGPESWPLHLAPKDVLKSINAIVIRTRDGYMVQQQSSSMLRSYIMAKMKRKSASIKK